MIDKGATDFEGALNNASYGGNIEIKKYLENFIK